MQIIPRGEEKILRNLKEEEGFVAGSAFKKFFGQNHLYMYIEITYIISESKAEFKGEGQPLCNCLQFQADGGYQFISSSSFDIISGKIGY